jgi:hypothetical protein
MVSAIASRCPWCVSAVREPDQPVEGSSVIEYIPEMAHYLVTGGAGFIGSHLCEELARRGETVRVVDSLITGKRANLAHVPGVEFIEGDLAEVDVAKRAVRGIDYVLHQAAIPSVPRSVEDPDHLEPRQRGCLAQSARGGARRRRQARRLCRVVVCVRQLADDAQGRDDADRAALAVCAAEAGGRAVLPDVSQHSTVWKR